MPFRKKVLTRVCPQSRIAYTASAKSAQNSLGKNWLWAASRLPSLPRNIEKQAETVRTSLSELRKLAAVCSNQVNNKLRKRHKKSQESFVVFLLVLGLPPPQHGPAEPGGLCSLVLEGAEQA